MEVIQHGNIIVKRFINSFKTSNSFLLKTTDCNDIWLFDIGNSAELFSEIAGSKVKGLFLTHSHFDHIFGIKKLLHLYPECIIYGSHNCIAWLEDDRRNLSFYYEKPLKFKLQNGIELSDGDSIIIGNSIRIDVFETPGHTEDCLTYKIQDFLVTGDAYIPDVPPVTKLKGGNKEQYAISLQKIKSLINNDTVLLPGHGPIYSKGISI